MPDGRWVADGGDHQHLKDWSKARLVWTSETAEIGPSRGKALRYGFRNVVAKGGITPWCGADVNAIVKFVWTPLDNAIVFKYTEIANLLRKHGGKTGSELKAEGK